MTWIPGLSVIQISSAKQNITNLQGLSKSVIPKLLRLSWMGYPLHRHKEEKWGFLEPNGHQNSDPEDIWSDDQASGGVFPLRSLKSHLAAKRSFVNQSGSSLENDFVREPPDKSGKFLRWYSLKPVKNTSHPSIIWQPFVRISACGFHIPFDFWTICNPTSFWLFKIRTFKIQTRPDFRSPL